MRGLKPAGAVVVRGHLSKPIAGGLCALVVCLVACGGARALDAGAAKIDLALEPGIPLDGDVARRGRGATSVHDPLHVRALYLEDDGVSVFLVSADLFAITPDLRARVLQLAPDVVPPENIILVATHTFSGPGGLDRSWLARQRGGRFMPELVDALAMKFSEAMQVAYDARKRCAVGYASGTVALGVDAFAPQAPIESRVTVLRVDDSDGNPIAIVTNFAGAANTAARVDSFALSADYPGAFCDSLESMTAAETVAIFLNGESGDRDISGSSVNADWSSVRSFGEALATRAKSLANEITCRELPIQLRVGALETPRSVATPFLSDSSPLTVLEVSRLAIAFLPGIPYESSGAAIRSGALESGYTHVMTVAPANGYIGAVAPVDRYSLVRPLGDSVYFDPNASDALARAVVALLPRHEGDGGAEAAEPPRASLKSLAEGLIQFDEAGDSGERGRARGASLLANYSDEAWSGLVPFDWLKDTPPAKVLGHWNLLGSAVDETPLLMALASDETRRLLGALPEGTAERLHEIANMVDVPMQHVWLMQLAAANEVRSEPAWSVGALFSVKSETEGLLVGLTIEHGDPVDVSVTQASPRGGHAYVTVGLPWQLTGMCGVNDENLVVASAPFRRNSDAPMTAPAELLFEETLAQAETLEEALAILTVPRDGIAGRVLVGMDNGSEAHAVLVEVGALPIVLDMIPLDVVHRDIAAPSTREARIARLLRGASAPSVEEFERMATDRDRRAAESDRVLGPHTRASVVLVPRHREIRVMSPVEGAPTAFHRIVAGGGGS